MQLLSGKIRPFVIGAAFALIALTPRPAQAAEPVHLVLDGQEIQFDVAPVLANDRTLVEVRALVEALGTKPEWNPETRTVNTVIGTRQIRFAIGLDQAQVDGQLVKLEEPARIISGRTMIPVRFFAEHAGMRVGWDNASRTIQIESGRGGSASGRDGSTVNRRAAQMVATARKYVGTRYAWGGVSPDTGFDCSGFIYYLAKSVGVDLPRASFDQFQAGVAVKKADLAAGDLVFFTTYADGASHVGIYDGQGNFINAQSTDKGVTTIPMSKEWWAQRYIGARRVVR